MFRTIFLSIAFLWISIWLVFGLLWTTLFAYNREYFSVSGFDDYFIPDHLRSWAGLWLMAFSDAWIPASVGSVLILLASISRLPSSAVFKINRNVLLLGLVLTLGFFGFGWMSALWFDPESGTLAEVAVQTGVNDPKALMLQSRILATVRLGMIFALPAMVYLWFTLRKKAQSLG